MVKKKYVVGCQRTLDTNENIYCIAFQVGKQYNILVIKEKIII